MWAGSRRYLLTILRGVAYRYHLLERSNEWSGQTGHSPYGLNAEV